VNDEIPDEISLFMSFGELTGISKPHDPDGIRPITMCETIRKLCIMVVVDMYKLETERYFKDTNYAVNGPNGIDKLNHLYRESMERWNQSHITLACRDSLPGPKEVTIVKVKSHAENRIADESKWSSDEMGNVAADRMASEDPTDWTLKRPNLVNTVTLDAEEVLFHSCRETCGKYTRRVPHQSHGIVSRKSVVGANIWSI
jgi:hypothetical protein